MDPKDDSKKEGGLQGQSRYNPETFTTLSHHEREHFWFRSRNEIISSFVARLVNDFGQGYNVLEVGCGTGFVLMQLEETCKLGSVFGLEMHEEGVEIARSRVNCPVMHGDIHSFTTDKTFSIIGLFDVIEHIEDDTNVLRKCAGLLTEPGYIMITVPAFPRLWSRRDVAVGHYRRYTTRSMTTLLAEAGLETMYLSYFMSALVPAVFLRRLLMRSNTPISDVRSCVEDEIVLSPLSNRVAAAVLRPEVMWMKRKHRIPFGTSLLAIARLAATRETQGAVK